MQQLNEFMADGEKNESIKMDPKLFDLLWEIYQESGSTEEIHIVLPTGLQRQMQCYVEDLKTLR